MKKIETIFLLLSCMLAGHIASAQYAAGDNKPVPPRWYSDKGYWVVESNLKTPDKSIVSFYNADRKLIYTEKVDGVVLNCKKKKTLMKLKRALEKAVESYEVNGTAMPAGEITAFFPGKRKSG